jgi:hypothetical protein
VRFYPLLLIHIFAGVIAAISGATALFAPKGLRTHRLAGNIFFISMLVMSASGAYMGAFIKPVKINAIAGVLTFYLVATAWLTVVRREGLSGKLEYIFLMVALIDGYASSSIGMSEIAAGRGGEAAMYFIFGAIAFLGVAADGRLLVRRGIEGAQRMRRHIWRMGVAMVIVTMSLFVGTPRKVLLPAVIHDSMISIVPVIAVAGTIVFWMWRFRGARGVTRARLKAWA